MHPQGGAGFALMWIESLKTPVKFQHPTYLFLAVRYDCNSSSLQHSLLLIFALRTQMHYCRMCTHAHPCTVES